MESGNEKVLIFETPQNNYFDFAKDAAEAIELYKKIKGVGALIRA
jgi:hypothetical protein